MTKVELTMNGCFCPTEGLLNCWKLVIVFFVQNCCAQDKVCGIRRHYKWVCAKVLRQCT